jgi:hypothetical protein
MPVVATELVTFASLNMPQNDTATSGGGIDVLTIMHFIEPAGTTAHRVRFSASGAARNVTITGRLANGVTSMETRAVTDTTNITYTDVLERLLKVETAAPADARAIIVETAAGVAIATIPAQSLNLKRMFYDSASTGSPTLRYEKFFWKNNNTATALNAAIVTGVSDSTSTLDFAFDLTRNSTLSTPNRLTAPTGIVTWIVEATPTAIPGLLLTESAAADNNIGIWLRLSLSASQAGAIGTYVTRLAGTTT